jgi:TolB-like protein/tetratricopeptide (TPR) repeat protein
VEASVRVLKEFEQEQGERPRRLGGFVAELRRRHVVRAAVAYAAVAFAALQAVQIIQQAWAFPDWMFRLIVVFTLLGFPLVMALAWVYEITPHGVRSTPVIEVDAGARSAAGLPRVALLAVTVLAVSASGWWWVRSTVASETGGSASAERGFRAAGSDAMSGSIGSLAVLPLESFSDQSGDDYFARGMHEALVSQLGQLDFVRVLSRTSSEQYDPTGKSAAQIGEDLGVDALVEGSVLRAEGKVRITAQLIETATDRHLWSGDYERDLVDIIALQREVAQAIVQEIRGELRQPSAAEALSAQVLPPGDPVATDEVMRGRMVLSEGVQDVGFGSSVLDSAAAHFQRAIGRDPQYAPAHSGLAQVHLIRGLTSGRVPSADEIRAAVASAQQAFQLDPENREVREVLAHVQLFTPPEPPGGPSDLPAAPEAPTLVVRMGADSMGVLMIGGEEVPMVTRTEAGKQLQMVFAKREMGSEESSQLLRAARRFSAMGLYPQALPILEGLLEKDPRNQEAWDELEQLHRLAGDLDAVMDLWRERTREIPSRAQGAPSVQDLERAVRADGVRGYWSWRLEDLQARQRSGRGGPVSYVELAECYAGLGNRDRALDLLEQGARAHDPRLRGVRADPVWDPYRRDERFIRVLAQADEVRQGPQQGRDEPGRRDGGRGNSGRGRPQGAPQPRGG